ncbi:MAG: glycoside hydrolase family 127 protein [Sedimentisphaerales bacterium]|nr:glycoside hydrolase family 127 protein [Sedimentisphaerales bacterium]
MNKRIFIFLVLPLTISCSSIPSNNKTSSTKNIIYFEAQPFSLKQVRLLDGPFKDAMELDRKYLYDLSSDRLLHTFRLNAKLPSSAQPLGGWESPNGELRGHTMGHYLSACALMYCSTGDEELKAKADAIVAELAKCQEAIGKTGYLSAYPETWFDRVEAGKQVWAPYYSLHKIYAGLLDMYTLCDNKQALEIAEKMAAWNKGRLDKLDEAHMQRMLNGTEQGGMNDVFANMYAITGNEVYLQLSQRFNQKSYVEPLLRSEDNLTGQHANSFIPNIIGTARQYELTGDANDRKIAEFFWSQVVNHRSYCTGGTSNDEHWRFEPDQMANQLGDCTQETCCTYNLLKLTRHLFSWTGDVKYTDYYERDLYNSILSTQNPESGMMMYFVPLAAGRWKVYNTPDTCFWCCTGSGMENHAKYGDSIYFHNDNTLYVNLFIPSELDWSQQNVKIRQETDFPEKDSTTLTVQTKKSKELDIRIRIPYWATQGAIVKINSEPLNVTSKSGSYLSVNRKWKNGDKIEITLPMSLHKLSLPGDESQVAMMYGPLVLAGQLGSDGLTSQNVHTTQNWYRFRENQTGKASPLTVTSDNINDWIKPVDGKPLTFKTIGQSDEITIIPFHKIFMQKYIVYWKVLKKES